MPAVSPPAAASARPAPPETLDDDPRIGTVAEELEPRLLDPGTDLRSALTAMADRAMHHLVVDGVRGFRLVAAADLWQRLAAPGATPARALEPVGDLTRPLRRFPAGDRRSRVARAMDDEGLDLVLVVDGEHPVGVVSARTLARSLVPLRSARPRRPRRADPAPR